MSTAQLLLPLARSSRAAPRRWVRRARAFTLIEMMVVVALVAILATVVGLSLSGGGDAVSLNSAQQSLSLMIEAARTITQRQKTRARLVFYADKNAVLGSDPAASTKNPKVLRFFGVIYAETDDPGVVKQAGVVGRPYQTWVTANDGATLPEGIYFVPSHESVFAKDLPPFANDSKSNALTDAYTYPQLTTMDIHPGTVTGMMQIDYGLNQMVEGTGDYYFFIEFAPDGFFYNINGNNNIYIGTAVNTSDSTIDFRGTGDHPNTAFTGMQLRLLGGAAPFRDMTDFAKGNGPGT